MTVRDCFTRKGIIGTQAEDALTLYDELVGAARARFAAGAGVEAAKERAVKLVRLRALERKRSAFLSVHAMQDVVSHMNRHSKGAGNGLQARLGMDIFQEQTDLFNVETLSQSILAEHLALLAEPSEKFKAKGAGFKRDFAGEENFVRAIYGEKTGDATEGFADQWRQTMDQVNASFRAVGGILPDLTDRLPGAPWRLPNPSHDPVAIRKAGADAWIDATLKHADVIDFATNEIATGLKARAILDEVYLTLSTDGIANIRTAQRGGAALANRRTIPRILHFKSAEDWLAYNKAFGRFGPFETMLNHVARMSLETALMKVLGPNPDQTMRVLLDDLTRREALGEKISKAPLAIGRLKLRHIEAQYRIVSGQDGVESQAIAGFGANIRNLLVGQQLGSTIFSAFGGDPVFLKLTTEYNGLSASRAMKFYFALQKSGETSINASKAGIIIEDMVGSTLAAGRTFADNLAAGGLTGQYADRILRLSFLTNHTRNGRRALQTSLQGEIADQLTRNFGDLDEAFQRTMKRYGVTEADWKLMQKVGDEDLLFPLRGEKIFRPSALLDLPGIPRGRAEDLALKLRGMAIEEMNFAVPTSNARVEALLTGGLKRGTVTGELARFTAMYKRFPVLVVHTHLMRTLYDRSVPRTTRIGYAARMMLYTTVMGTLAYQLQQISQGKDPANMDPTVDLKSALETWTRGSLKGGALGIYADVLFQDANMFGRSPLQTLAGPAWTLVNKTWKLTIGNFQQGFNGEDTNVSSELIDFIRNYAPTGGNLWYARLAKDRLIFDQLQMLADPRRFFKRRRRIERLLAKRSMQGFFFRVGETLPARAPDLGAVAGGSFR